MKDPVPTPDGAGNKDVTATIQPDVPEPPAPPGPPIPVDGVAIATNAAADVAKEARHSAEAIRTSAVKEAAVAAAEQVAVAAEAAAFRWAGSAPNTYSGDVTAAAVKAVTDAARNAATTIQTAATDAPTEAASAISGAADKVAAAAEAAAFRFTFARIKTVVEEESTCNSYTAEADIGENLPPAAEQKCKTGR